MLSFSRSPSLRLMSRLATKGTRFWCFCLRLCPEPLIVGVGYACASVSTVILIAVSMGAATFLSEWGRVSGTRTVEFVSVCFTTQ